MRYWPALDGLRGLAVLAVMLFHAQVPQVSGGFLGVDIFFALSGFLITSQLLLELDRSGRIQWRRFFLRRMVRLQPALMLLLLAYALGWVFGWVPGPGSVVARDVATVLLAMAHWARAFDWYPPDYLGHAWSLGVEEQFYLAWALLLAALGAQARRCWRVFFVAVGLAVASVLWMWWLRAEGAGPVRLYNGLDTRAMTLLCGCVLASWLHMRRGDLLNPTAPAYGPAADNGQFGWPVGPAEGKDAALSFGRNGFNAAASWCGLFALGLLLLAMGNAQWRHPAMFPWGYLAAALASCLLIWSLVVAPASPWAAALAWRPLVAMGRISYGLYLWHFPLYRLAEAHAPALGIAHGEAMAVASVLTMLAAWASFVWVEWPLRQAFAQRNKTPLN